jgi:polyphenol oxidase
VEKLKIENWLLNFFMLRPAIFDLFPNVIAAESTRVGGVSPAPFNSLNLGWKSGDSLENVRTNRQLFFGKLGIDETHVATSLQIHGVEVLAVNAAGSYEGYDALVTNQPDIAVGVTVADCTPILIYDAQNHAVAAIHAGWRGTVAQIVSKTLQTLQQKYGTKPIDCFAYVGTCIDADSFEVGDEVAEQFEVAFKRFDAARQKYMVDLKKANAAQLTAWRIPPTQIEVSPHSTVLNNDLFFSHRQEKGRTGRMMAVISMRQPKTP